VGAFAADRIQLLYPLVVGSNELKTFPIPERCFIEKGECSFDAAITGGSLLCTVSVYPGPRFFTINTSYNATTYPTANVPVAMTVLPGGEREGIPENGVIAITTTSSPPIGPTAGTLVLTLARSSMDTPVV
jgi:hypothetical protein